METWEKEKEIPENLMEVQVLHVHLSDLLNRTTAYMEDLQEQVANGRKSNVLKMRFPKKD